jgi:hypothetical protein
MVRRLTYLLLAAVLLTVMSLPIFAVVLAARGEIVVDSYDGRFIRMFLLDSDKAEGIGIQRVRGSSAAEGCLEGSVRYFLWQGTSQGLSADYCVCSDGQGGRVTVAGACEQAR